MTRTINRIAVLGSGVMGSRIAAHFANAGIPSTVLDIVPKEPTPDERSKGLTLADRTVRNRIAREAVDEVKRSKLPAFFVPERSALITIGNFDDDAAAIAGADWVVEAVTEKLEIKRRIFELVDNVRKPGSIVTSNTSGIPIAELAEGRSDDFRKHFCGTHFFNPPRYMRLLEIIPSAATDPDLVGFLSDFGENVLGKGVVVCNDTPNFIANRIGIFSMLVTIRTMVDDGLTIEEVDQITGPVSGRPKSGTFRTADMVGIDTLVHVAKNLYAAVPDDPMRNVFVVPPFIETMTANGWLGDKTKQGFYKKQKKETGETGILSLDHCTMTYVPRRKPALPSVDIIRNVENVRERIRNLASGRDRAGTFYWKTIAAILRYSAQCVPGITDEITRIDDAMKWGFNWELGPFETWDALGVEESVARMRDEGSDVPPLVDDLLRSGRKSFYGYDEGTRIVFDVHERKHRPVADEPGVILLPALRERKKEIRKNPGASLIDIGDGVLCLEFHSKMNAVGEDIIRMIGFAADEAEKNFAGLVVGNEEKNFSAGANIMSMLLEAQEGNWDELDSTVRMFQGAMSRLKYSKIPVVAAPFGFTLGGGCEICLASDRVHPSAEVYMGLVETGVGLIPAGGGTKEMLLRNIEGIPADSEADLFPFVKRAFQTIGMAKVSTSAPDAARLGYLRPGDRFSMNPKRLIGDAKNTLLGILREGYTAQKPRTDIPVLGEPALANLTIGLYLMREAGAISEYDEQIGQRLATVLCGGALSSKTLVSEQYLLDLEREAFLGLLGQPKTQERMRYMLEKGKPLRN